MPVPFDAKEYWEGRLTARFDLGSVGDIGLPTTYNDYLYRVRAAVFRRLLVGLRLGQVNVLDVGSGTGFYVNEWLKAGAKEVMGSDLTVTATQMLRDRLPSCRFAVFDIGGDLPEELRDRQFDVVSAFDMLFHIVDDERYAAAISNFARLVRPGGRLIFSDNLTDRTIINGPHQISRAESDVVALLTSCGFTREAVRPMFVLMNDPVRSGSRVLHKLFGHIYAFAARGETQGRLIGAALLPIERVLTSICRRGPSTEIFVWRRKA